MPERQPHHAAAVSRRTFLHTTVAGVAAGAIAPRILSAADATAAVPSQSPETLAAGLYKSLNDDQRAKLCFAFDHPLRSKVDNNWHIVKQTIGDVLTADQQAMVRDIFRGMHSEEYADRVFNQVEHDAGGPGTFNECSVAMFGEPGGQSAAGDASGVVVIPPVPTSNAQARISAIGNPASTSTITRRAVQAGSVKAGNTVVAN